MEEEEPAHSKEIQACFLTERGKPPGYLLGRAAVKRLLALLLNLNHCFLWCPKAEASAGEEAKGHWTAQPHGFGTQLERWNWLCSQVYSHSHYAAQKCITEQLKKLQMTQDQGQAGQKIQYSSSLSGPCYNTVESDSLPLTFLLVW